MEWVAELRKSRKVYLTAPTHVAARNLRVMGLQASASRADLVGMTLQRLSMRECGPNLTTLLYTALGSAFSFWAVSSLALYGAASYTLYPIAVAHANDSRTVHTGVPCHPTTPPTTTCRTTGCSSWISLEAMAGRSSSPS